MAVAKVKVSYMKRKCSNFLQMKRIDRIVTTTKMISRTFFPRNCLSRFPFTCLEETSVAIPVDIPVDIP